MAIISDGQIKNVVRRVLTRHWVDVSRVDVGSFKGVVRMTGELKHSQAQVLRTFDHSKIELIEVELRRQSGVKRIYYEFDNWRKHESGRWKAVDQKRNEILCSESVGDCPAEAVAVADGGAHGTC